MADEVMIGLNRLQTSIDNACSILDELRAERRALLPVVRAVASEPCRTPRPHPPCRPGDKLCVPCEARAVLAALVGGAA